MKMPEEIYSKNIEVNKQKSDLLKTRINIVSVLRLILVLICIAADYVLYRSNNINVLFGATLIFILLFLFMVYFHDVLFKKKSRIDILIKINKDGLNRVKGNLNEIDDGGQEYLYNDHPFINDLDIFGCNSLFKIANTCATEGGRKRLADILMRNIKFDKNEILDRQECIHELSGKINWRQKLIVESSFSKGKKTGNINEFIEYSKKDKSISSVSVIIAIIFILITIVSIFAVCKRVLPISFILLDLMVNYLVVKTMSQSLKKEIIMFESIKRTMSSYSRILGLIQDEQFKSNYLIELQRKLISEKSQNNIIDCKSAMKKLDNIFGCIGDSTHNAYYFIANTLFFLDIFLMRSMQKWRKENGAYLEEWLEVMYKIDEMCSFANLDFEHKSWCYPQINSKECIEGTNIGHPLLSSTSIRNSFSLKENHKIALITGSNMSGKSTFLRTIGINMIMSYSGAPVCADSFSCGIMNIYTCMRTKDNLEESISSFYAEILRIKMLIEAAKDGEKVFVLLDEIFKGTNSQDRHIGASILIKQLIGYGGMGLVSTHDLELCDLEKEDDKIVNYNFREFYEDNKIKFDYILRPGKSETRNAVHLMRLAGIEIK